MCCYNETPVSQSEEILLQKEIVEVVVYEIRVAFVVVENLF